MTFEEFTEKYEAKLASARIGTLVRFGDRRAHPAPPKVAADSFCQSAHIGRLGDAWVDLEWDIPKDSRDRWVDPASHLAKRLERTLAYRTPWLDSAVANQLALDFYALFAVGRISRLTNGLGNAWTPITEHTFDAVYVAMDDASIGVILVYDED